MNTEHPGWFLLNRLADHGVELEAADAACLDEVASRAAETLLERLPGHATTPLRTLAAVACELGLQRIDVKDEGNRNGLGSFKALGGAHAVARLVLEEAGRRLGRIVDSADLLTPAVRQVARGMTLACATDGNHGRAVAAGAAAVGARSVVFVHERVSEERRAAIARFGAEVVRVAGTYDDAVAEASRRSASSGWAVVSDTSRPGYERIPRIVMQGYTVMVAETLRQIEAPPSHVFIQAGVGGLAAAVAGHLALVLGPRRPAVTVVEPARAACVFESIRAGKPIRIPAGKPTVMAMLECYEPSLVAWRILSRAANAFLTVDEDDAIAAMRLLANPSGSDPAIVAGESGGVGLAGLLRAARHGSLRRALSLDRRSRVLVFNTEGATDAGAYEALVRTSGRGRP